MTQVTENKQIAREEAANRQQNRQLARAKKEYNHLKTSIAALTFAQLRRDLHALDVDARSMFDRKLMERTLLDLLLSEKSKEILGSAGPEVAEEMPELQPLEYGSDPPIVLGTGRFTKAG